MGVKVKWVERKIMTLRTLASSVTVKLCLVPQEFLNFWRGSRIQMRCRASVRLFQIIDNSIHFLPQAECKIIVGDNYLLQDSSPASFTRTDGRQESRKCEKIALCRSEVWPTQSKCYPGAAN